MGQVFRVTLPNHTPRFLSAFLSVWLVAGFLTQITVLPLIKNNIGPFELLGVLAVPIYWALSRGEVNTNHTLIRILFVLVLLAAVSQILLPQSHRVFGLIQLATLVFLLIFVTLIYNWINRFHISPEFFLRAVGLAVLIVGPWVLLHGIGSGGDIQAAGPFRNRAHMGSYMLTAFWLVLVFVQWPGRKKLDRIIGLSGVGMCLYAVAASGRRSVYLSLIVGLVALLGAVIAADRGRRTRFVLTALFAVGFLGSLYYLGDELTPQTAFFKSRVGQIGGRLGAATGVGQSSDAEANFFALQRQGVMMAVRESPVIGIGWGGFHDSRFSPTGHEVHSTPLRFLAELGLAGLAMYLLFMGTLLTLSVRLFLKMRRTPYGLPYLTFMLALWSLSISYLYNRHITERAFWILLAVLLAMEVFARDWHQLCRQVADSSSPNAAHPSGVRPPRLPRTSLAPDSATLRPAPG